MNSKHLPRTHQHILYICHTPTRQITRKPLHQKWSNATPQTTTKSLLSTSIHTISSIPTRFCISFSVLLGLPFHIHGTTRYDSIRREITSILISSHTVLCLRFVRFVFLSPAFLLAYFFSHSPFPVSSTRLDLSLCTVLVVAFFSFCFALCSGFVVEFCLFTFVHFAKMLTTIWLGFHPTIFAMAHRMCSFSMRFDLIFMMQFDLIRIFIISCLKRKRKEKMKLASGWALVGNWEVLK